MILLQLVLILLLVEGILLAEQFAHILKITLENQASKANVVVLLALYAPEVFELALPIALFMAVYMVGQRCREARELIILATMGVGAQQFIGFALLIGLAAQTASLMVSGLIQPYSQFATRHVIFQAQSTALREGAVSGRFYEFPGYFAYASAQVKPSARQPLFIYNAREDNLTRVIASRHASLEGPDASGVLTLLLNDTTIFDHPRPVVSANGNADPAETAKPAEARAMIIGNYSKQLLVDDLLRFPPRGEAPGERGSIELLSSIFADDHKAANNTELGRRLVRSLLCLITPLMAALALSFTGRARQAAIPALFCAGLMGLDIAASTLAKNLAAVQFSTMILSLIAATATIIVVVARLILARQSEFIGPALARS